MATLKSTPPTPPLPYPFAAAPALLRPPPLPLPTALCLTKLLCTLNPIFMQVLPLTGVTTFLLSPDWVAKSFHTFNRSCEGDTFCLQSGFITFAHAQYALLDKDEAWNRILALPDKGENNVYDIGSGGGNGNSKVPPPSAESHFCLHHPT